MVQLYPSDAAYKNAMTNRTYKTYSIISPNRTYPSYKPIYSGTGPDADDGIGNSPGSTIGAAVSMKRKLRQLLVILFLFGVFSYGFALDPAKDISQYVHDGWSLEDGLPQNSVQALIQDRNGYIWLATEEGFVRFDGVHFEVFDSRRVEQMPSNVVQSLYQDRQGNLWVGTLLGALRCNMNTETFTEIKGLSGHIIYRILQDQKGHMWFATDQGVKRLKNGRFTSYSTADGLLDQQVLALCEGGDGKIWMGTKKRLKLL